MATEKVETLVKSQNLLEPPSKTRKTHGRETETEKKKEPYRWLNVYYIH